MLTFYENTIALLQKPLQNHLSLIFAIFGITTFLDLASLFYIANYDFMIVLAVQNFFISYCIVFIYTLIKPKFIRRLFKYIFVFIFIAIYPIDLVTCVIFHHRFDINIAAILLGTNNSESQDFIIQYILPNFILLLIPTIIIIIYLVLLKKMSGKTSFFTAKSIKRFVYLVTVAGLLTLMFNIYSNAFIKTSVFGKINSIITVSKTPDLKDYLQCPKIKIDSEQPNNVVVIIGESYSKTHSSLYGYVKNTNPNLSSLEADSSLYVFNNIKSSGLNTIDSFKEMMSTYCSSRKSPEWYKCTTLPEIISYSNYESVWISNQLRRGLFDNVITGYADLCDSMIFVSVNNEHYNGVGSYDERVLLPLKQYKNNSEKNNFYFIHLMGSHIYFKHRYPEKYNKFKYDEYAEFPENQRYDLAAYDNSVLYNDYVVNEIIRQFEDKEAIVFYFSDHSIDIYESDSQYCGHAREYDPKSCELGANIPFMVYMSDSYKKKFPETAYRIKNSVNKKYNTEDILYTIMDVMNVKFKDNDDVNKYSLFN